jgi:hypothetical protein
LEVAVIPAVVREWAVAEVVAVTKVAPLDQAVFVFVQNVVKKCLMSKA